MKKIKRVLISVYHKEGLENLLIELSKKDCEFISTGGTSDYLKKRGLSVTEVSRLTGFPEILGGRVKTLHPAIFGGILGRNGNNNDINEMKQHNLNFIDLVIVDLYPFEETVATGGSAEEIIEKIDIGGISLIRAAAKNHAQCAIISHKSQYQAVADWLSSQNGCLNENQRLHLALRAFAV